MWWNRKRIPVTPNRNRTLHERYYALIAKARELRETKGAHEAAIWLLKARESALALHRAERDYGQVLREGVIPVHMIPEGECFRKPTGEFVYLRISTGSIHYLQLADNKVYGVCRNGNIAVMDPETSVVACDSTEF